ncbi:MAG: hypothetical protein LT106_18505 [Burkholderiaceae bacterium]|nr:hypothetical protein [Burkholderiaceae bacterium]
MAQGYVSVMDPAYEPPDDRRFATLGALRGLLDISPVGVGDLLHQVIANQSRMTMPGVIGGLLGVPRTPPPGEALSSLLGIGAPNAPFTGRDAAYGAGRALTNAVPLSLLGATRFTAPSRGGGSLLGEQSGAVKPEAIRQALEQWLAMKSGEPARRVVRGGLVLTDPQLKEVDRAYQALTHGKQPPYQRRELDIATGHIYDARISGQTKPSGQQADAFAPEEVARWLPVAGADDAAVRRTIAGRPFLEKTFVDPITGESYPVQMPIHGDLTTGRLWAGGLVPKGKTRKPNP